MEPNRILSGGGHQYLATTNYGNLHQGDNYGIVNYNHNHWDNLKDPGPRFFRTSSYQGHKNVNRSRVPGTCQWFLDNPTFQKWKNSDQADLLWLSAYPGCGKSVLAKALIDERLVDDGSAIMCYFFFKENEEQDHVAAAICAVLHQLFCAREDLFQKHAKKVVELNGDYLKIDFDGLWQLLLSAVSDPSAGKVICILDALDECREPDRRQLIQGLELFYTKFQEEQVSGSHTKFIVTSRPYVDIERRFAKLIPRFGNIHLSGEANLRAIGIEINMVMNAEVDEIARDNDLSDEIREALKCRFSEIENTTYLWLDLTLQLVSSNADQTKNKLLKLINELPVTVNAAYEKILERCGERNEQKRRRLLKIIVAARRPLRLSEIDVVLEVEFDSKSCSELELAGPKKRETWIRDVCGLFVKILDSRVYLIHQTAREFLLRREEEPAIQGRWQHSIDLQNAHLTLAKLCITYLLLDEFRRDYRSRYETTRAEHGFLLYSANYWTTHTQQSGFIESDWAEKVAKLCDINNGSLSFWLGYHSDRLAWGKSIRDQKPPLFWAAHWGLIQIVANLLNNHRMEVTEDIIKTAASNQENGEAILKLLLQQRGEGFQITEGALQTAAAKQGNADNVKSLLTCNSPDQITNEVIRAAITNRRSGLGVLKILLRYPAVEIEITDRVIIAVANNQENGIFMLEMLLQTSNVKITNDGVKTAASRGQVGKVIMKLLLERRSLNTNFANELVKIAIESPGSGDGVIEVLLDYRGADISITSEIIEAIVKNEQNGAALLNIFLDKRGTDVKITDKMVNMVLENRRSGVPMMELLLKHRGLGIITDDMIYAVVANDRIEIAMVNFLLERKEDFEITDKLIVEALTNERRGGAVVKVLLGKKGSPLHITDQIIQVVSANKPGRYDLMNILIQQEGVKIRVTEKVIRMATQDEDIEDVVEPLLFQRGPELDFSITDEMLEIAMPNKLLEAGLRVAQIEQRMKRYGISPVGLRVGNVRYSNSGNPEDVETPERPEMPERRDSCEHVESSQYFDELGGFVGFGAFEDSERFECFEGSEGSESLKDFEDSEGVDEF